jgi:hypothetical protein
VRRFSRKDGRRAPVQSAARKKLARMRANHSR